MFPGTFPLKRCDLIILKMDSENVPSTKLEENLKISERNHVRTKDIEESMKNSKYSYPEEDGKGYVDPETKKLEEIDPEIHFHATSKSYSCLQGKSMCSTIAVIRVSSKTTSNEVQSGNNKISSTDGFQERTATTSDRSMNDKTRVYREIGERGDTISRLDARRRQWYITTNLRKEKDAISQEEEKDVKKRITDDVVWTSPFELIEIYSSRNCTNREEHGGKEIDRETSSSKKFLEEIDKSNQVELLKNDTNGSVDNIKFNRGKQSNVFKDISMESFSQEREDRLKSKLELDIIDSDKTFVLASEKGSSIGSSNVGTHKTMEEKNVEKKLNIVESLADIEIPKTKQNSDIKYNTIKLKPPEFDVKETRNDPENVHFSKDLIILPETRENERELTIIKNTEKRRNCERIKDEEVSLPTIKETDFKAEPKINSSSINVLPNSNNEKLNCENQDSNVISSKDKNMKIIIEKRGDKKNYFNKKTDKKMESDFTIGGRKRYEIQEPEKIDSVEEPETKKININYPEINICKMLRKIHETVARDWQRMERLRMKLQNTGSVDGNGSTIILQLLDKTVTRCKSYIHGANDSCEAETKITKLLSKYIVELVRIVNENKITLEQQEKRVDQMHLETSPGQHVARRRSILNEIAMTSSYWSDNISCLIEVISRLVKNVMAENEEKENVKSPRRYKAMHRRVASGIPVADTKQKSVSPRLKTTKANIAKKENTMETEASIGINLINTLKRSKSKTFVKYTPRYPENVQPIDKREKEKGNATKKIVLNMNLIQSKQSVPKTKHRANNNPLPAWKPGGTVKMHSSSSVTALNQKHRILIHAKEKYTEHVKMMNKRGESMDHIVIKKNLANVEKNSEEVGKRLTKPHYTMEEKHGRERTESKKPSKDLYSEESVPTIDIYKMTAKRSNVSLKRNPKMRTRQKAQKFTSKSHSESFQDNTDHTYSKCCENASVYDVDKRKTCKDLRIFPELGEMTTNLQKNEEDKFNQTLKLPYQIQTDRTFEKTVEKSLTEEEMKITEEEPTRDIDSKGYNQKLSKNEENFEEDHKLAKDLPQKSVYNNIEDLEMDINFKNCQSFHFDEATFQDTIRYSETSTNEILQSIALNQIKKDEEEPIKSDGKPCMDLNQSEKPTFHSSLSKIEKEESKLNCHAASLSTLKEFLCDQGIDVNLVNKAEKYLKEKRRAEKSLKKKCRSFLNVSSRSKDDQLLEQISEIDETFCKVISKLERNSENDIVSQNSSSDLSVTEKKDNETCTIGNDYGSQISSANQCKVSKSLQNVIDTKSQETQTNMNKVKDSCYCLLNPGINVSSMTESLLQNNNFTQTDSVLYVSKFVSTEQLRQSSEKLKIEERKENLSTKSIQALKAMDLECTNKRIEEYKNSSKEYSNLFRGLLNQMYAECNDSITIYKRSEIKDDFSSSESNESLLSKQMKDRLSKIDINVSEDAEERPKQILSTELETVFQEAAVRACNVFRAIDIYKQKLRNKLKKLNKRLKRRRRIGKTLKTLTNKSQSVSKADDVSKRITWKKNDKNENNDVTKLSQVLRQKEITSAWSKSSLNLLDESEEEEETFESVLEASSFSSSGDNFRKSDIRTKERSSSNFVLKDVTSLMKFLVKEVELGTFDEILCVRTTSNSKTSSKSQGQEEIVDEGIAKPFSLFSRESLLPLIYGIVCSFVFWCLQFTISCEVVL